MMITLKPVGGLGNRMRAISSAISLQKARGDRLFIIWDHSHVLNCPFESLFVTPKDVRVKNIKYGGMRRIRRILYRTFKVKRFKKYRYDISVDNDAIANKTYQDSELSDTVKARKLYIETYKPFYDMDRMHFFDFNPDVIARADTLSDFFSDSTIGIHIRRGDHKIARYGSPTPSFIKLMEGEINKNQDTTFYLATDSENVEKQLRERFGSRIYYNDQKINKRTTREGVMDALADMICLSRTAKIYGSYKSTFSVVASEMNQTPLVIARSKVSQSG